MSKSVVVIGGGLMGLSSALLLSEQGADVTVIDANALGSGAARGNAGYVCQTLVAPLPGPGQIKSAIKGMANPTRALRVHPQVALRNAPWFLRFAANCTSRGYNRGRRALIALNETNAASFERMRAAGVDVSMGKELLLPFHSVAAAEHMHADLQTLSSLGVPAPGEMLDGAGTRALAPAISDHIQAGFILPGDRSIDPRAYVDSLIAVLADRGVRLVENAPITKVVGGLGRVKSVITTQGTFEADEFVLTTGAGTRLSSKHFRLKLLVIPGQGYNVALPVDAALDRPVIFEEVHVVATPFNDRIRLGGTMEFGGHTPKFDMRRVDAIITSMKPFVNLDWDSKFDTWAGSRPITADGLPFLGRPRRWTNLVVAAGHGMFGLTLAPPTAAIVADLVMYGGTSADIAPFDPDRFG